MKEIEERAEKVNPNNPHGDTYEVGQYFGFQDGFEVGYNEALNKACKWLRQNMGNTISVDIFIGNFNRAMKGE